MSDKFAQLKAVITPDELQELTIRRAAVDRLRDMYEKTPLDKVGKEWRAAKNELEVEIDKLWQKYNKEAPAFDDVTSAWEWLKAQGYNVGKSTVYKAAKDGLLRKEADGRVLEIAVKAYAAGLRKKDAVADPGERSGEKVSEEIKKLKLQNEKYEHELDIMRGKYVLRDDLEMELCSRVAIFEAAMRHYITTQAPALVDACGGDRAKAPDVAALLGTALDAQLNAMADVERFQVIMIADEVVGEQEGEE